VIYFTSHVICCTPATATSLPQDNMFVGSLMIATQAVCGGMLSRSVSVTKLDVPTCNYPVGLSAAYRTIDRPVCNYSGAPCTKAMPHRHILISAFSEYRPWPPLHVYILTIKQVQLANMEPISLDDPKKYLGIVR